MRKRRGREAIFEKIHHIFEEKKKAASRKKKEKKPVKIKWYNSFKVETTTILIITNITRGRTINVWGEWEKEHGYSRPYFGQRTECFIDEFHWKQFFILIPLCLPLRFFFCFEILYLYMDVWKWRKREFKEEGEKENCMDIR